MSQTFPAPMDQEVRETIKQMLLSRIDALTAELNPGWKSRLASLRGDPIQREFYVALVRHNLRWSKFLLTLICSSPQEALSSSFMSLVLDFSSCCSENMLLKRKFPTKSPKESFVYADLVELVFSDLCFLSLQSVNPLVAYLCHAHSVKVLGIAKEDEQPVTDAMRKWVSTYDNSRYRAYLMKAIF